MNERGFTLVEALFALAILALLAAAMIPAFHSQLAANTRSEVRTAAVLAAQEVLEDLRSVDPATMPTAGVSTPRPVAAGDRLFEVVTTYCVRDEYCDPTSRHLTVEVYLDGRKTYDAETVYTQLR